MTLFCPPVARHFLSHTAPLLFAKLATWAKMTLASASPHIMSSPGPHAARIRDKAPSHIYPIERRTWPAITAQDPARAHALKIKLKIAFNYAVTIVYVSLHITAYS
ncbi:hypothetical protein FRC08_013387 [Ceratobasidium sp. 394]|nr:hypothetical protein FRC08_013387 [Ceratobasidium sp. 394]